MALPTGYGQTFLFSESVSAVTATPSVDCGTVREEGNKRYVYAYNGSTSTAGVGYGVVVSAYSAGTVTVSSIAGDLCYGVVVHNQLTPATYGWVLTRGTCNLYSVNAFAERAMLVLSTDGAFESILSSTSMGAHTVCAMALGAATSAAVGVGYVKAIG